MVNHPVYLAAWERFLSNRQRFKGRVAREDREQQAELEAKQVQPFTPEEIAMHSTAMGLAAAEIIQKRQA